MSCVLRIEGKDFKVDDFLNSTSIDSYKVWHVGDPIVPKKKGKSYYSTSGCNIDVSKADFDNFEQQKADAIVFLSTYKDRLNQLSQFGLLQNESPSLDFGVYTRMLDLGAQFDRFEPKLLRLAGSLNITIELSQYPPANDQEQK